MGRKKLPDDVRKAHMFRIRMTEAERAVIDAAAQAEDQPSSEWARTVLLNAAQRKPAPRKGGDRRS